MSEYRDAEFGKVYFTQKAVDHGGVLNKRLARGRDRCTAYLELLGEVSVQT